MAASEVDESPRKLCLIKRSLMEGRRRFVIVVVAAAAFEAPNPAREEAEWRGKDDAEE